MKWILERFEERSTWIGVGVVLSLLFPGFAVIPPETLTLIVAGASMIVPEEK
jgi:hypothetical protein